MLSFEDALLLLSKPRNCLDILNGSHHGSGVYTIQLGNSTAKVYCDMVTDGGGWVVGIGHPVLPYNFDYVIYQVFQRRQDGSVNFSRDWESYAEGFGGLHGEFWLGMRIDIARMIAQCLHYCREQEAPSADDQQQDGVKGGHEEFEQPFWLCSVQEFQCGGRGQQLPTHNRWIRRRCRWVNECLC